MTQISSTQAVRTFDQPDMRVVTATGNGDCRRIDLGEVAVGRATCLKRAPRSFACRTDRAAPSPF